MDNPVMAGNDPITRMALIIPLVQTLSSRGFLPAVPDVPHHLLGQVRCHGTAEASRINCILNCCHQFY